MDLVTLGVATTPRDLLQNLSCLVERLEQQGMLKKTDVMTLQRWRTKDRITSSIEYPDIDRRSATPPPRIAPHRLAQPSPAQPSPAPRLTATPRHAEPLKNSLSLSFRLLSHSSPSPPPTNHPPNQPTTQPTK